MNPWHAYPVPAQRDEALHGDRIVRCFAERPASVHAMLARAVAQRGAHEALVCDGRRWTYAELDAQSRHIAAGLRARGVAAGDRVAMFISNRPEFVFVLFALQRLGAIAVPVGVREARTGLAFMLKQCGATGIVFDADLADRIPDDAEVPSLRLRISIGAAAGAVPLNELQTDSQAEPRADEAPAADVREQDTAVILYTSGTTGHPKGAMLTHLNIAHSVLHFEACMRLQPDDRSALAVPASHVTGLIAIILAMVHVGGTVVIVPAFKAPDFVALLARERVTHTLMVPAMYTLCLMSPEFASHDLSRWRIGGYGGAPMPVATIDQLASSLPGLVLLNAYGATETTSPTTLMPAGLTREHADSVGVALPCARIVVMDDDGVEVPPDQTGELWIGGPMVVPGYWDNPAATAASFTAGYWHSGDLGSVDADGFFRIFDRKKDMLNRGGFKVYSVEVENTLMALPGVVEAAIVGRPCPVLGERVHAFIHAPGVAHDDAAVQRHCAAHLADYKVPESITWSDTPLPRNANGKLVKRSLRERLAGAGA
ncbi:MAG: O-succinylbenzoic acid--CoA ligase [Methylibium sp. NZG]|nr:MAG: O-succinylbenzoic acid--CoA ligase [Methylibium sp. NZG]